MKNKYKKITLCVSFLLIVAWCLLGTGASLAWFADTSDEIKNIFQFGEFDLNVSFRMYDGGWKPVEQDSPLFDDEAVYEPGYVQVVYLKFENPGTVPVNYKTAVTVTDYTEPVNIYGQKFHLQDYLKFGLVVAETEDALFEAVATRNLAEEVANMPLNHYYETGYETDYITLGAKETVYLALIVWMPTETDNVANYRGDVIPRVELGMVITVTQKN